MRKYPALIKGISFSNHKEGHDVDNCAYAEVLRAIVETNWKGLVAFETCHHSAQAALADLARAFAVVSANPGLDS